MARRVQKQLELPAPSTWGGQRADAGRKPKPGRPSMGHDRRVEHNPQQPVQVTLRAVTGAPSLRSPSVFAAVQGAVRKASYEAFRVIHFSAQQDHMHFIVEANSRVALRSGIQGLAIRIALTVNRAAGRRGRLWGDRYHARALTTPREVRASMVYVLLNFRKHLRAGPGIDPRSSGACFDGWDPSPVAAGGTRPVAPPRTWLARWGWRQAGGLLRPTERPGRHIIERERPIASQLEEVRFSPP